MLPDRQTELAAGLVRQGILDGRASLRFQFSMTKVMTAKPDMFANGEMDFCPKSGAQFASRSPHWTSL